MANVIRLLLLTGARRGEVLGMKWADIDLAAGTWFKASLIDQAGQAAHEVPLSAPCTAIALGNSDGRQTANRKPPSGTFVFPGGGDSGHIVAIKKSWKSICKAAGIRRSAYSLSAALLRLVNSYPVARRCR